MNEYSISEVTQITGISRTTVLYYESKGLITPRQDEKSGYRKYTIDDISQMMFYQSLKPLGISVEEYAAAAGKSGKSIYKDVFDLILLKKADYMKLLSFHIAMWEETMAYAHILRNKEWYYQVQASRDAWTFRFEEKMSKEKTNILKNWHDYFLQRNLSYFFTEKQILSGDHSFQRGLTCYADCAIRIDESIRKNLIFMPGRTSLLMAVPIDLNTEDFSGIFQKVQEILDKEHLRMHGDPWGNIGYRDENPEAKAKDYLFLWIPIKEN